MDIVELAIQAALKTIPEQSQGEQWQGERPWSLAVKSAIVRVGQEFGWRTAGSRCSSDDGHEWLYDIVWYQSDKAEHMTDVPLVAECEWGGEEAVKADFQKLLVSRSRYRVMVFQSSSDEAVNSMIQRMLIWIGKFHRTTTGDRYLFVGWVMDHWVIDNTVV
jgi:hypothetical protein